MKAIVTKYHGPTNFKGSRITASDEDGNRTTISYPHELSGEAVHRKAAEALCEKMGWGRTLIGGSLKNGYVFVFADGLGGLLFEAANDLARRQAGETEGSRNDTAQLLKQIREAL